MSASELYSRLLFPRKQGYPLFCPQLSDTLPEAVRRTGTEIGDVGVVNMYGAFDPIFNITREANNSANQFGVPVGFQPLVLGPHDIDALELHHPPGADISNTTINKKRLDLHGGIENNVFVPAGVGAVIEVSTSSKETAILLLPDGASRQDLRPLRKFRDYALTHAQSWYEFVNGRLDRMTGNGDLYLVTGVTKSTSWSVAAVENRSGGGEMSLKLKAAQVGSAGALCAWEWETANSSVNSGPRRHLGEESWRDNQTVFLRGFKVAIRSGVLRRRPKALLIVNSDWSDMMPRPSASVPFSQPRPGTSLMNLPPGSPSSSTQSSGASDDEEPLDDAPNLSHPLDSINEFLLDSVPDAMVAVTHDNDLAFILTEVDDEVPECHELINLISTTFMLDIACGGACLQVKESSQDTHMNYRPLASSIRLQLPPAWNVAYGHNSYVIVNHDKFPADSSMTNPHLQHMQVKDSSMPDHANSPAIFPENGEILITVEEPHSSFANTEYHAGQSSLPPATRIFQTGMDPTDYRAFYPYTPNEVKHRKRTTSAQIKVLEGIFKRDTKPNAALRTELAAQLNMTARGIQVWFQNRRAKEKTKACKAKSTRDPEATDNTALLLPRASYKSSSDNTVFLVPPIPYLDRSGSNSISSWFTNWSDSSSESGSSSTSRSTRSPSITDWSNRFSCSVTPPPSTLFKDLKISDPLEDEGTAEASWQLDFASEIPKSIPEPMSLSPFVEFADNYEDEDSADPQLDSIPLHRSR